MTNQWRGGFIKCQVALLAEIQGLMQTLERVTAFYLRMDLQLMPTDVRRLLYDVAEGYHEELAQRGASLAVEATAEVGSADLDAAKLHEAFSVLMRLAVYDLPELDPRVELRAYIANGDTALMTGICWNPCSRRYRRAVRMSISISTVLTGLLIN